MLGGDREVGTVAGHPWNGGAAKPCRSASDMSRGACHPTAERQQSIGAGRLQAEHAFMAFMFVRGLVSHPVPHSSKGIYERSILYSGAGRQQHAACLHMLTSSLVPAWCCMFETGKWETDAILTLGVHPGNTLGSVSTRQRAQGAIWQPPRAQQAV